MKKIKIMAILIITFSFVLTGCGNTPEKSNNVSKTEEENKYLGKWGSGRGTLDVLKSDKGYIFNITWATSAFEYSEWNYLCDYDAKENLMNCTGNKTNKTLTDENTEKITKIYEDGTAIFKLDNNEIMWQDNKEDAGKDIKFIK